MTNLTATSAFELRDPRVLEIIQNHTDVDIFRNIHGAVSESWLVDRTNTVQLPFRTTVLADNVMPVYNSSFRKSLDEICISRALELSKDQNKIYIMWSGGIDSTLILVSFLKINIDLDKLVIVCNRESIKENFQFYEKFIRGKIEILSSEIFMQEIKMKLIDGLIISGEQGDLIYGQDFGTQMFKKYGKEYLNLKPTKSAVLKFFLDCNMSETAASCWYDIFMKSAEKSPRPIDTIYDFSWWAGFNWRWQWSLEKVKMRSRYNQNLITFFSSEDFQQWSYGHKQTINSIYDFKKEYKKNIFEYTKDENYLDKIKVPSATIYYSLNAFAAITDDGERHTASDFSLMNYYQKNNFISNWISS